LHHRTCMVMPKHTITSMHSALTFLAQCIVMNHLHISRDYGCWLQQDWRWFFRTCLSLNVLQHKSQRYGYALCKNFKTFHFLERFLTHSQRYGHSAVGTRRCVFRLLFRLNVWLHTSQRYACSPVCTNWCNFTLPVFMNVLLHISQRYGCSPVCTRLMSF
jgi:hypothetical protein